MNAVRLLIALLFALSLPASPINWSGVALLSANGSPNCTAIAIAPNALLTAAHCVAPSGAASVTQNVSALLRSVAEGTSVNVTAAAVIPYPTFQAAHLGADIAVILLNGTLPSWVATYGLYALHNEMGQVFDAAGFSGATLAGFHSYRNRFENNGLYWSSDWLSFDYDTGLDSGNSLANFGASDLGVPGEGMINFGDSGGPLLIDGLVAGIPSGLWQDYSSPTRSGAIGFAVRIAPYRDWILATIAGAGPLTSAPLNSTAVPEPGTAYLGATAALAWLIRNRYRRWSR